MGPYKIPLAIVLLIVLALIIYSTYLKIQKNTRNPDMFQKSLNTLLVLGSFNLALGMIGQITGIWDAIDAIKAAADINLDILFTGIKISFGTTIFGLATFMIAIIAWLLLTYLPLRK
jgi:biopolymer transport protein ExbB/TolQ